MRRFALLAIVACVWVCALSGTGRADQVIFSSFGPGDSFNSSVLALNSGASQQFAAAAVAFQPSATANLTGIDFPADGNFGLTVNVVLAQDSGGSPGAALETFSSVALGPDTILTENSVLHPSLTAGTTYWLELVPNSELGSGGWNGTSPEVAGDEAEMDVPGGSWQVIPTSEIAAFDVRGTTSATPEPASLSLLGIGAVGLIGFARVQRKRGTLSAPRSF